MGNVSFVWLAALSTLVCLAIWRVSKHPHLTGRNRALRNHLKEFTRLWGALACFYAIQFFWPQFSAAKSHWAAQPALRYVPPILVWQLLIAVLLACANLWLRRAGLELEISQLPDNQGRWTQYPETQAPFFQHVHQHIDRYIGGTFLTAVAILAFASVLPTGWSQNLYVVADGFQVSLTSALFVSLGFAYKTILRARWIAALSVLYAAVQLPYPIFAVPGTANGYLLFLFALKLAHGGVLCVSFRRYAQGHPFDGDKDDPFGRVARRLLAHAAQQPLFQLIAGTTVVAVSALVILGVYSHLLDGAVRAQVPWLALAALQVLSIAALVIGLQFLIYLVATWRFRVDWTRLAKGVLRSAFAFSWDSPADGLRRLDVRRAPGREAARGQRLRTQVILLHGLFHDGASAWGLLPVLLLDRPEIEQVRVLSYTHHLATTRKSLERIVKELKGHIGSLIADYQGRSVLIGHSLGAILTLRMLPALLDSDSAPSQVCLVGPPLLGSPYAKLAFPFAWSRILGRRSSFLVEVLKASAERLRPVKSPPGGEEQLPTISLIQGTRDEVVGELIRFTALPATVFDAPSSHGLGMVFLPNRDLAQAYFKALEAPIRAVSLARQMAENLAMPRMPGEGGILRLPGVSLALATVSDEPRQVTLAGHEGGGGERFFMQELERAFRADGGTAEQWTAYWRSLETHVADRARPAIVTAPWHAGSTLVLYLNRMAGCFGIFRGTTPTGLPVLDGQDPDMSGTLVQCLHERFPRLNVEAPSGVFGESCDHLKWVSAQGIEFTELKTWVAIDCDGSYYGVYVLRGKVTASQGISQVLIHLGAARAQRVARELAFSAFDEVRDLPMRVSDPVEGKHCYLITLETGRAYDQDEIVAIRFSFRHHYCMFLERDLDCYRLQPVLAAGARASIELFFPDRCSECEGFVIRDDRARTHELPVELLNGGHAYRAQRIVEQGDAALGLRYSVASEQRRDLFDLVATGEATDLDAQQIAAIESISQIGLVVTREDIKRRLQVFREGMIVARVGDAVVGYINYIRWHRTEMDGLSLSDLAPIEQHHVADGKFAFIWFGAVLPAFRGGGIARVLVSKAVDAARQAGNSQLQMVILPKDRRWFQAAGFDLVAPLANYLPAGSERERTGLLVKRSLFDPLHPLVSP